MRYHATYSLVYISHSCSLRLDGEIHQNLTLTPWLLTGEMTRLPVLTLRLMAPFESTTMVRVPPPRPEPGGRPLPLPRPDPPRLGDDWGGRWGGPWRMP